MALGGRRGRSLDVSRVVRAGLRRRGLPRRACGLASRVRTLCELPTYAGKSVLTATWKLRFMVTGQQMHIYIVDWVGN